MNMDGNTNDNIKNRKIKKDEDRYDNMMNRAENKNDVIKNRNVYKDENIEE